MDLGNQDVTADLQVVRDVEQVAHLVYTNNIDTGSSCFSRDLKMREITKQNQTPVNHIFLAYSSIDVDMGKTNIIT